MDRHRRQFTFWPSRATHSGEFHPLSNRVNVITPAHFRAPSTVFLNRSLSWNS
ncbi:protein YoaL [Kosakonia cowanii]|uniref:protein YoaL n=1 Tax=Kosakonia cowanii TaxID=208223 RepID=UPI0035E3BEF0